MVDFNRMLQDRQLTKQLRAQKDAIMATPTRNRFNATPEDNDNNTESERSEITADDITPPTNGHSNTQASGMSLEDLEDAELDSSRDEDTRKRMNPPVGDWTKSDRWEVSKVVLENDSQPGDLDPAGRTIIMFKGKPEPRSANGLSYEPTLNIRWSPDYRVKVDFNTKQPVEGMPDYVHGMYIKLKDMHLELHGEVARSLRQLIRMGCEDTYVINTSAGDQGLMVQSVKPRLQDRKRGNKK